MMNIGYLKTFYHVAETCNFTQAARDLYLTQPAVSQQIQALEHNLGVMLFNRARRKISLTAEGLVLLEYTRKLFGIVNEIEEEFQNLNDLQSGRIRLGATSIMGTYYLPQFIAAFNRRYPGVNISLVISNSHSIAEMVYQGQVDLGFGGSSTAHPALSRHFLHREPLKMVTGRHTPLASVTGNVPCEALLRETFILREQGTRMTGKVLSWFKDHCGGRTPPVLIVNNMEATKALVAQGLGITVLPCHAAGQELQSGSLIPLMPEDFCLYTDYFLLYRQDQSLKHTAKAFLALLFAEGVPMPEDLLLICSR